MKYKKQIDPALRRIAKNIPYNRGIIWCADTYIETAEYDCLHDEGVLYGKKLREAGAHVELNETRGTFHGYDSALNTQIAIRNIKKRIFYLRRRFCNC